MNKFLIILLSLGLLLSFNIVRATCDGDVNGGLKTASDYTNYCDFIGSEDAAGNSLCEMPEGVVYYCNPLSGDGLNSITDYLIDFIFKISIVVVPVLVVYGAFMIITAAGDADKIKQAKALILWTLIGFTIVLLSRGVSDLIEVIIGI